MNYQIKSGDCLWNIVKNNYNCNSNKEISEIVNTIAKENNIEDINVIHTGANLVLPYNEKSIFEEENKSVGNPSNDANNDSFQSEEQQDLNIDKLLEFEKWTMSEENYTKALNGEEVEDFEMFEFDASTYSSDIKEFSQEYINLYDEDKNGELNLNEFITMSSSGQDNAELLQTASEIYNIQKEATQENVMNVYDKDGDGGLGFGEFLNSIHYDLSNFKYQDIIDLKEVFDVMNTDNKEGNENNVLSVDEIIVGTLETIGNEYDTQTIKLQHDMYNLYKEQFSTFSFDENKETINAGEFASVLYSSDLDLENYAATGDIASSIDGKLNYLNYQTLPMLDINSDSYKTIQSERADFYNNFYAE